ncbi:MAG TPA: radical SAM protein [Thermoanaerobaculia bacterium]
MTSAVRPYLYYDAVVSICPTCFRKTDGKIVFQDERVWMLKHCRDHGSERVLISDDVAYYRQCREVYIKPPEMPLRRNTPVHYGCPYDCGLCPDHEQHSCLTLVEITDACNLRCPICYAGSGPERQQQHRPLAVVESMLDAVVANEGEPDVVQISGGEPTIHPEFFAILDAAKRRPIRHLMVNTNGVRIAREPEFAERLASYKPAFEIYLQFDSLRPEPLKTIRGGDLREIRMQALDRLNALDISTTLVVTLQRGVNDDEIGEILDFALKQPCVRGVTLQPVQVAGRLDGYSDATNRLTLSEVRRKVLEQSSVFAAEDLVPVPCHPDSLCMGYAFKGGEGSVVPLTSMVGRDALINGSRNTIIFEQDPATRKAFLNLFSTALGSEEQPEKLKDLLCCLPRVQGDIGYANVFRLLIVEFIDAQSFDLRSVKKSCIHIVHPDGRLIPFDTFNLFYRDDLEASRLAPLKEWAVR